MSSLFSSIPQFFHILWTAIICLFSFKRSKASPSDIEACIPQPSPVVEIVKVADPNRDLEAARDFVPHDDSFTEIDLNADHHSIRRPSRRVSAVDPVKSRIVDATFKQVQDKTIDVVKPVIVTSGSVSPVAYSAEIEYCQPTVVEPRASTSNPVPIKPRSKHVNRAVQFALPPEEVPSYPIAFERRTPNHSSKIPRDSISDLLDLFPSPPTLRTPTSVMNDQLEYVHCSRSFVESCVSPVASEKSSHSSAISSASSSDSLSYDTVDTSPPTTPDSTSFIETGVISSMSDNDNSWREQLSIIMDASISSKTFDVSLKPSNFLASNTNVEIPDSDGASFFEYIGNYSMIPQLIISSHDDSYEFDDAEILADGAFLQVPLPDHEFVDVDLDESRGILSNEEIPYSSDYMIRPHQLNHIDEEEEDEESKPNDYDQLDTIRTSETMAYLNQQQPVLPLRIVKNQPQSTVQEEVDQPRESGNWEESLEKVLQAFKEAQAEDFDFRELFYRSRDSSFYSQSSLAESVKKAQDECSDEERKERLQRLDESFDSIEKSFEEILSILELPDIDSAVIPSDDSGCMSLTGGVGVAIQNIRQHSSKHSRARANILRQVGYDDKFSPSDNEDADDERKETDTEDDQWSDLLELDSYFASTPSA